MNDAGLIKLYYDRNESAISETKAKYGAYCFTVANNLLGNASDAEECVSSALYSAWDSIPPARPERLGIYLARITRNLAFNRIKAENRKKRGGGNAALVLEELSECIPAKGDPASEAELKELKRSVNAFLRGLPEREASIFIRRAFRADTVKSIAKDFGMTENAVMSSLSRTRKKLRQYLIKEGLIDE